MDKQEVRTSRLRILLVEDNHDIARNISENFEKSGHIIDYAQSAEVALNLIKTSAFDLLIIDIMLPGMDGINLCQHIRKSEMTVAPILMLTARDTIEDKLIAFDAGADDYLTKPFSTRELLARSIVLSRRKFFHDNATLIVGDICLNTITQTVTREGKEITLGRIGFLITRELLRASPGIVLRDDLEHTLWGDDRPDSDALRTHISVLRKALDKPFNRPSIHTIHGAGWKLIDTSEALDA